MKYPNPTFLKTASKVRHTRRTRTLIVIAVLCVLTLIVVFILKMASMQERYRKEFPALVGAATMETTTTEPTTRKTRATTVATTETEAEVIVETTEPMPSFHTEETTEETSETTTEATTQNNEAEIFTELTENFYFRNSYPLQKVTHDLRDQYLDDLKQSLEEYAKVCEGNDERVCLYYMNLKNGETMGVNELQPIVPSSAFNLPVEMIFWNLVRDRIINPDTLVTYETASKGNSSHIEDTYQPGKRFKLRTVANYVLKYNDNQALELLLGKMGGMSSTVSHINVMSCYVDYSKEVLYKGAGGIQYKGPSRSSCYDMTEYAAALYRNYINDAKTYQKLINDLSESEVPSGFTTAFGDNAKILHCAGRNNEYNAYTDVAIIDGDEPICLTVYCECASSDRANQITADMGTLVQRYLSSLH